MINKALVLAFVFILIAVGGLVGMVLVAHSRAELRTELTATTQNNVSETEQLRIENEALRNDIKQELVELKELTAELNKCTTEFKELGVELKKLNTELKELKANK